MTNHAQLDPHPALATPQDPLADAGAPAPQVWPSLRARDARGLIRFLVDVVGFEEIVVYGDGDVVNHAQLSWPEGGGVMLGTARSDPDDPWPLVPGSSGAYVVTERVDEVHARAVSAGAEIVQELQDTDYGSHTFALRDPEGNHWSFGTYRGESRAASAG